MIVLLAESAWIYLELHSILTASNPGMAFSPAAVLAPYGLSALTTYLLGLVREPSPRPSPLLPSLGARLLDAALAAAITALHLALCLACLLTVLWWEMYRGQKLLDPSWLNLAMEEVRGPLGGFPPAVSLAILGVALWWRGTQLARERSLFPRLVARFLWGTVALLAMMALVGAGTLDPAFAGWLLAAYLLFGLTALAAMRLEMAQERRLGGVDGGWQWRSAALALLLLVAGFGIAFLLLPQLAELAASLRHWLMDVLLPALVAILKWIVHLLGLDKPPEPLPLPAPAEGPERGPGGPKFLLSVSIREIARGMYNIGLASIILMAIYSRIKAWVWHRGRRAEGNSSRERPPWGFSLRSLLLWPLRALLARWPSLYRWLRWATTSIYRPAPAALCSPSMTPARGSSPSSMRTAGWRPTRIAPSAFWRPSTPLIPTGR